MSAAAAAKAKRTDLWLIFSIDRGFHTARGWSQSADFAHVFSHEEAAQFVDENCGTDVFLTMVHYDPRSLRDDVRLISHQQQGDRVPLDLHQAALDALHKLKSHHGAPDLQVEVIHQTISTAPEPQHLTRLVQRAVRDIEGKPVQRRFEAALNRFDVALEEYRCRLSLTRHFEVMT